MAFSNRRDAGGVSGGAIAAHMAIGVVPTGTIDGSNAVFTVPDTVISSAIDVFVNGVLQSPLLAYTFTLGNTITFLAGSIPPPGSEIFVDYIK
jgi:hypothetical protein